MGRTLLHNSAPQNEKRFFGLSLAGAVIKLLLFFQLREKLVSAVVDNADVTKDTSLADVAQISSTLSAATAVPNENSEETTVSKKRFSVECRK